MSLINPVIVDVPKLSSVGEQRVEIVERKGIGHPDTICDGVAEAVSLALCREYQQTFGRILHHNVDKALLVAGQSLPKLGGGTIAEPMRFALGDRAIFEYQGKAVPVAEIAEATTRDWLRRHLRFVDPDKHLVFQNELKPGSPELVDAFERQIIGANDTSAAVGYAPLSETEQLVLATERLLNSSAFKKDFPFAGEDIKVMAIRRDRQIELTVAMAFVDRFIPDPHTYFARKYEIVDLLASFVRKQFRELDGGSVKLNTLDDPSRAEGGMYLTVLGTSAEGGDCGEVGRGNRVNGVIPLNRPVSGEAAAGKNPVSHVGKIYSLLSHHVANEIYQQVPGLREVYVWFCSRIGEPIDSPAVAATQVCLKEGVHLSDVEPAIQELVHRELHGIQTFCDRLARGEFSVC